MKKKKSILLLFILLFLNFLLALHLLLNYKEKNENESIYVLNFFETKINSIFEEIFFSVELIETIVKSGYDEFTMEKLNTFVEPIGIQEGIRNIAILPSGIVEYIYPMKGNEKAIGDNIFKMPQRKLEAEIALKIKETIICGPYNLTQGGIGIIARKAIFLSNKNFQEFWGMVAVVMDAPILLKRIELESIKYLNYEYELSTNINGLGKKIIEKSLDFDKTKAKFITIKIPNGKWELGIQKNIEIDQLFNILLVFIVGIFLSILLYRYVNKKEKEMEFVKNEVYFDNLTGLYNRKILEKIKTSLVNYTVFYIDLNDFKYVNDTYGHDIGDKLLIEVSNRIKKNIRESDLAIRVGGDEFVIVIFDINEKFVEKFLQKIKEIQKSNFIYNKLKIKISLSYGHATSPLDGANLEEILKLADSRMYLNKRKNKLGKIK